MHQPPPKQDQQHDPPIPEADVTAGAAIVREQSHASVNAGAALPNANEKRSPRVTQGAAIPPTPDRVDTRGAA